MFLENQQKECDREGEYANIRHYWSGLFIDDKDDGTVMVRCIKLISSYK